MIEINAAQIATTVIMALILGMVGMVFRRLGKVESSLTDFRLAQVRECQAHREKIYDRINGKAKEVREEFKDEITGVHALNQ